MKAIIALLATFVVMVFFCGCGVGPSAPENLTVTDTDPITLSWSSVSDATSYSVYRGTSSGAVTTKTLLASGLTSTTYTDSSAVSGVTYYYQVKAVSSDGSSAGSDEVSATLSGSSSSFSLYTTVDADQNEIILTWITVANAVSYNIYRATASGIISNKTKIKSGVTAKTYTDGTVSSGITYYYQVTAVNSSGVEMVASEETDGLSF